MTELTERSHIFRYSRLLFRGLHSHVLTTKKAVVGQTAICTPCCFNVKYLLGFTEFQILKMIHLYSVHEPLAKTKDFFKYLNHAVFSSVPLKLLMQEVGFKMW